MDQETVRKELRSLRKLAKYVDAVAGLRKKQLRRTEYIKTAAPIQSREQLLAAAKQSMDLEKFEEQLRELCALEKKYMSVIRQFSAEDQVILLEGVIGGVSYIELGNRFGYSEEGIRKRVQRLIRQMAVKIEK